MPCCKLKAPPPITLLTHITDLNLSNNNLRTPGVTTMVKCLQEWNSLRKLNLSTNQIRIHAANNLFNSLCNNDVLQELILTNNMINGTNSRAIVMLLTLNKTVKRIDLRKNYIPLFAKAGLINKCLCNPTSLGSIKNSNHTCDLLWVLVPPNISSTHTNLTLLLS